MPDTPTLSIDELITEYSAFPDLCVSLRAIKARIERLEGALQVPTVWSYEERDGMMEAFDRKVARHGMYETLFAVAAWLLRHRAALADTPTATGTGGEK